ncbi:MAG: rhodanese-like domain-containing protein [Clostridiales bacterium]|nr:rhodanese-like domain-containing protein [Candidatus Crickella equi]
MKKKLFAILMSAMMLVTFMPMTAFAAEPIVGANFRSMGVGNEATFETKAVKFANEVVEGKYKLISTEEVAKLDTSKVLVVDTMPAAFSNMNRIAGAENAPIWSLSNDGIDRKSELKGQQKVLLQKVADKYGKKVKKITKKVKKDNVVIDSKKKIVVSKKAKIVVYCGFVGCDRSHNGAAYLVKKGFKNVYRYAGGAAAWEDAGHTFVSAK